MDKQTLEFLIQIGKSLERIDFFNAAILGRLQKSHNGQKVNLKWDHIVNDAGEIQNLIEDVRQMAQNIEGTLQQIYNHSPEAHLPPIPAAKECCKVRMPRKG